MWSGLQTKQHPAKLILQIKNTCCLVTAMTQGTLTRKIIVYVSILIKLYSLYPYLLNLHTYTHCIRQDL